MSWQSRVPQVLDALVTLWGAVPDLAGKVLDGPTPLDAPELELLSVGHDGNEDGTTAEGSFLPEGLGGRPDREQFTVTCTIAVLDGSGDIKAARTRTFELYGIAREALAADHTLGGTVLRAYVGDYTLRQLQDQTGAKARLEFRVAVDAYTVR